MAITIDWANSIINIPRADMILIQSTPIEVRQLNIDDFRKTLNDLQDDPEGIVYPTTHKHVAPISVGGVDLARVVEILAPYTVTFEDGAYAVNIVGGNSNIADRVNINNVGVRTANSAGLPDLSALQAASFGGAVTVEAGSQYSGTTYPVGLQAYPVNNIPDAVAIAQKYSLRTIRFLSNYTLDTGDNVASYRMIAEAPSNVTLSVNPGADTTSCQIEMATVTGNLDGGSLLQRCVIDNLNYINGYVYQCMLNPGTISLGGSEVAHFLNCYSGVPGVGTPTIDCGVGNTPLAIRGYNGGVKLINKTGTAEASIDLDSGKVIIDSTCTNGTIVVRGDGKVVDSTGAVMNSGTYNGSLTLINETSVWDQNTDEHTIPGTFGEKAGRALTVPEFLGLK